MAKKRQADFAKVKLKVGRKVKAANATSTDFKAKKVVVRGTTGLVSDPVRCLTASAAASSSIKLMHLTKCLVSPVLTSPPRITGDLLNALARHALDMDEKVRRQARLCVQQAVTCLHEQQQSLQLPISILLTHVKCGLTHLNPAIANDSRKILSFLVTKSSPEQAQQFMELARTRIWKGKAVSLLDLELAAEIVTKFHSKSKDHCQHFSTNWSPSDCHIPWSSTRKPLLSQSIDVTFSATPTGDDAGSELDELMAKVTFDGMSEFVKRSGDSLTLSLDQGRRLVALLKLSRCLHPDDMRSLALPDYEIVADSSKKKACSALTREIKDLVR